MTVLNKEHLINDNSEKETSETGDSETEESEEGQI